jgi:hypothetical protein
MNFPTQTKFQAHKTSPALSLPGEQSSELLPKEIDVNQDSEGDLIECYQKSRRGMWPTEDSNDYGAAAA